MRPSPRDLAELDRAAIAALERAYAPYSRFRVGAALLTDDGRIHAAGNVENASYPVGLCAERAAIAVAIAAGARRILAVSIATARSRPVAPCGMCRQALVEHAGDIPVRLVTRRGRRRVLRLGALLPAAFGPSALAGR
ncbi:MAG: cytidine deaminase [Deltaproteobacteria bacterium]|nr:cytidine deaminase [Deltaproteobacteria bacterium]